jgi:hypothetical protein
MRLTASSGIRKVTRHRWVIAFTLLSFLVLHSVSAIHKHVSAVELDACFVCQLVDHQPLNVPQAPPLLLLLLQVFFCAPLLQLGGVILGFPSFERPRSRAPPSTVAK